LSEALAGSPSSGGVCLPAPEASRVNPEQQERLRKIGPDLHSLIASAQQLVEARDTQGIQAAIEFEMNGTGRISMSRTISDLQDFIEAEHRLLVQRSIKAELDLRDAQLLLLSGSILATLFLFSPIG
jgi:CHASE3 domain sensor protein